MNRRRRFSVCRSFSMETLERRSMLAADGTVAEAGAPFTEWADGQSLQACFSLNVPPRVFEFETTGLIACEPAVSVEPLLALDVTTCGSLQFIDGDDIWNNLTFVESGLQLTSEIVDLSTNRGWDADTIKVVWDEPVLWCGVGVQTDTGDLDNVAAPVESPAAGTTSDEEALVVVSSSDGSSPSTAKSTPTAQAFAAFAASFGAGTSFGPGGGDFQSGLPFVGGRRTARR